MYFAIDSIQPVNYHYGRLIESLIQSSRMGVANKVAAQFTQK